MVPVFSAPLAALEAPARMERMEPTAETQPKAVVAAAAAAALQVAVPAAMAGLAPEEIRGWAVLAGRPRGLTERMAAILPRHLGLAAAVGVRTLALTGSAVMAVVAEMSFRRLLLSLEAAAAERAAMVCITPLLNSIFSLVALTLAAMVERGAMLSAGTEAPAAMGVMASMSRPPA